MKKLSLLLVIVLAALASGGQGKPVSSKAAVSFDSLIKHFQENQYRVVQGDGPLAVSLGDTVLKNPFGSNYPASYSVIFHNRLVSLFDPGGFACYRLETWERDKALENRLNAKKFDYHWLLDNQLVARSAAGFFYFADDSSWKTYVKAVPLEGRPKLFEDERYLCYADCFGEWGGTIYFYNKQTAKTYFTGATCANTVVKKGNTYHVLSQLGHMMGSSDLKEIADPERLTEVAPGKANKMYRGVALGYADSSGHVRPVFRLDGLQTFSSFPIDGKTVYLVNWRRRTFLAQLRDTTFFIVHPLFNDGLYTHRPVTTLYRDITLVNLDFYGIAGEKEVAVLVVRNNRITCIDWNEKHKR